MGPTGASNVAHSVGTRGSCGRCDYCHIPHDQALQKDEMSRLTEAESSRDVSPMETDMMAIEVL